MFESLLASNGAGKAHHVSPNTPFHKQLRWLMNNPPDGSVVMTVTPTMAQEMLRYNVDDEGKPLNRPTSTSAARNYARQIKEGKWVHTGQPIIFGKTRLIDGQHRLMGCIEAGKPITVDVRFGIDDRAFAVIDIGKKRTASDIFAINGVPNNALMAAATRWVVSYRVGNIGGKSGAHSGGGVGAMTPEELYEAYMANAGMQDSARFGHMFAESKLAPPSMMTALHYLCAEKSKKQADEFFDQIGTGFGFASKSAPAFKLHKRLVENATGTGKIDYPTIAAYTVKAWGAMRRNQPVGLFRWRGEGATSEPFPKII